MLTKLPSPSPVEVIETVETPEPAPVAANGSSELATAILAALNANKGFQKIPFGQNVVRTAHNPTGKKRVLRRPVYVNGFLLTERTLSDDEIALLDKVVPGKYIDKLVDVSEVEKGDQKVVYIYKKDGTINDRMVLAGHAPTFAIMLQKIVAEAASR